MAVDFRRAESVAEACALLAEHEDARAVSGGTALAILLRQGLIRPELLVGLGQIAQLREIDANEGLRLGAAVPIGCAERHPAMIQRWPVLAETLRCVATRRIRNMATIGGGLAHADPAQDPPVTFTALGATVLIARRDAPRRLAAGDLFAGYFETSLQPGEVVVGVEVPPLPAGTGAAFLK